jgi:hypothetical protein
MEEFYLVIYFPKEGYWSKSDGPERSKYVKHASNDGIITICGKEITDKWWILDNSCKDKTKITCKTCRKIIK